MHLRLLTNTGPHDDLMTSAFQASLQVPISCDQHSFFLFVEMWFLPKLCFCCQVFVNVNGWFDIWYCWLQVVVSRACVFAVREVYQTSHVTSRQLWRTVPSWRYAEQTALHVGCILMTLCTHCTMIMAAAAAISSLSHVVHTKMSTTGGSSNIRTCNTSYLFIIVCHTYWS